MPRGVRNEAYAARERLIVERVLLRVTRKRKWSAAQVADIILASLTPSRVRYGVVGPCFYCGDEYASTVDHMDPLESGGVDGHPNVVSCCLACNVRKGTMSFAQWQRSYPYGSDRERTRKHYRRLNELADVAA